MSDPPRRAGARVVSAAQAFGRASLLVALLALAAGCASFDSQFPRDGFRLPGVSLPATAQYREALISSFAQPIFDKYVWPYIYHRVLDALDIFEVGVGWGWGLGAEASGGLGFAGIEKGRYSWLGIFGVDQMGVIPDDEYLCIGLPFSLIYTGKALTGGGPVASGGQQVSGLSRAAGALLVLLGFEDGIGGPNDASSGYATVGPVGYSPYGSWMSSSFPVGGSAAVGPLAVVARARGGAAVNFVTGFLGIRLFERSDELWQ